MPNYRFHCRSCDEEFEDRREREDPAEQGECVVCGSRDIERDEELEEECGCECEIDPCDCEGCC